jgi:hypothetical protein
MEFAVVVYRPSPNGRSFRRALVRPSSIVPAGLQNNFNRQMFNMVKWESQSTTKFGRKKPLLGGRHFLAPVLGPRQVSKKYLMRKLCR